MKCFPGAWLLVISALLAGCHDMRVQEPLDERPTYVCRYVTEAPAIDGRLNDRAWSSALIVPLTLANGSGTPKQPTAVRAVWDEKHLFLAFECTDNDIWAGMNRHDDKIYEQEVVEVFINENKDRRCYVELEVSPNNTTFDTLILNPGGGRKFKNMLDYECDGWRTAVHVDGAVGAAATPDKQGDRGWTVEMAIPFDQLILAPDHPPRPGTFWCWNLYRIDRPAGDRQNHEYTAWSPPLNPSYHTPERFGWLVFRK